MKKKLTKENLIKEAQLFCVEQSKFQHKELYGVTDGKAVGTLIEYSGESVPLIPGESVLIEQKVSSTFKIKI